jgi:hypothetical protein
MENGERVGFVLISPIEPNGEPGRVWTLTFDSYVPRPYTKWQLIVSIEQLLYRRVIIDENAKAAISRWVDGLAAASRARMRHGT